LLPDRLTFVKLFKSDNVTKLSSLPPINYVLFVIFTSDKLGQFSISTISRFRLLSTI